MTATAAQLQALADKLQADPSKNSAAAAKLMKALEAEDEVRRFYYDQMRVRVGYQTRQS